MHFNIINQLLFSLNKKIFFNNDAIICIESLGFRTKMNEEVKVGKVNVKKRDLCYVLPTKYEVREELKMGTYPNPNKIYVFRAEVKEIKYINKQVLINTIVNGIPIKVIHYHKLAPYIQSKKICLMKGIIKEETCFFPDIFDLRTGVVAMYTNFNQSALNPRKNAIMEIEEENLRSSLSLLHFPNFISDASVAFKRLLIMELSCFINLLNKQRVEKEPILTDDLEIIQKSLPFSLTETQQKAIQDIKEDLGRSFTTRRLIYGDVGSGKTAVAFCATKMVLSKSKKKVIILAPTSLLAEQIFRVFQEFDPLMKVQLVTSKTKKYEEVDVFVGTHALLHRPIDSDVGLVVIDEQHRFGVNQRTLLPKTHGSDVIMMTATPIPRTMEMMLKGYLSFSKLQSRKSNDNIQTIVSHLSRKEEIVKKCLELSKSKLVLWVVKAIKDAEKMYEELSKEHSNVYLVHGKLKEKDKILANYGRQVGAFLIATTVIEVGIDLDIKMVIIESADNFGLAQIHQIRGRVGRREDQGVCVLMGQNLAKLKLIRQSTSGFEISQLDLEKRGHGMVHASLQSGFTNFHFAKSIDLSGNVVDAEITEQDIEVASRSIDSASDDLMEFFLMVDEVGI